MGSLPSTISIAVLLERSKSFLRYTFFILLQRYTNSSDWRLLGSREAKSPRWEVPRKAEVAKCRLEGPSTRASPSPWTSTLASSTASPTSTSTTSAAVAFGPGWEKQMAKKNDLWELYFDLPAPIARNVLRQKFISVILKTCIELPTKSWRI